MTLSRQTKMRSPQVFNIEEANLEEDSKVFDDLDEIIDNKQNAPFISEFTSRIRWGALLLSALAGLSSLALTLSFFQFVSIALQRQDWIGWVAFSLLVIAGLSTLVLIFRELTGLIRLKRLHRVHTNVSLALAEKNLKAEKEVITDLQDLLKKRPDCRWGLARMSDHAADVRDAGDLLRLADREVLKPLDVQVKKSILQSSKRVATVTAISPLMWVAMLYVMIENLRMLRTLATLYGGRPGWTGSFKLAGMVISHIIASGGLALTEDLLGQFLGQDLLRRISRRLGEGAFNGALTARVGVAAITVIRPLPFLDAPKIKVRDMLREIFHREELYKNSKKTKVS